jgi:hypothetical protein
MYTLQVHMEDKQQSFAAYSVYLSQYFWTWLPWQGKGGGANGRLKKLTRPAE